MKKHLLLWKILNEEKKSLCERLELVQKLWPFEIQMNSKWITKPPLAA
jgi:hypothetical protein